MPLVSHLGEERLRAMDDLIWNALHTQVACLLLCSNDLRDCI